jgi:maltooligosyltrehalose trehalohydrolase
MTSALRSSPLTMQGDPAASTRVRRYPVGAEVVPGGAHFRVWAPSSKAVSVVIAADLEMSRAQRHGLQAEGDGYFSGLVPDASAGQFYKYALESGEYPDPASRYQPLGPHGPSEIIDPSGFGWTDAGWRGPRPETQVIYELHIGTFTREGIWRSAMERLASLVELGVTTIEVMPVADFAGDFGWGYDGVNLFAPSRLYGRPDDFRVFVDRAHALGLSVILDVVYNHFGPDGCYLREFSRDYFSTKYTNEWGDPLNFDGENSEPVREFFIMNAEYWISEFHLDGLRLDATQQIFDDSPEYVVAALTRRAREVAGERRIFIVAENEPQDARLARPAEAGGHGLDALWNDDFHHSARVALTGQSEAYYTDYRGTAQEFVSAAKWGFLFQGQRYRWQKNRRGTPSFDLEPFQFVNCLQNHDQVANSLCGARIHELTSPAQLRAMTALLLLNPATPMLFQGQEFAASARFNYFAAHKPELAALVAEGRRTFVSQFPSARSVLESGLLHSPERRETFTACKLNWEERESGSHAAAWALHRDLIRLRREDPVVANLRRGKFDGAVLSESALVFRYFSREHGDRLLIVNLGALLRLDPAPEPLLAPPADSNWLLAWSSEDPRYDGCGTPPLNWEEENWILPARSALFFTAEVTNHANASRQND